MHSADWVLVVLLAGLVAAGNARAMRYNRSVADFVAANRSAGPYLLATADGTAGLGAVSIVASLERFSVAGFAPRYWLLLGTPVAMVITLSGFVRWRYRATRSLTMCQFFELRQVTTSVPTCQQHTICATPRIDWRCAVCDPYLCALEQVWLKETADHGWFPVLV